MEANFDLDKVISPDRSNIYCLDASTRRSLCLSFISQISPSTGLLKLFWSSQFYLFGRYGVPFSWWIPTIAVASLYLEVGALIGFFILGDWIGWFPIIGGGILLAYIALAVVKAVLSYSHAQVVSGVDLGL
jgi:hypothetical protein